MNKKNKYSLDFKVALAKQVVEGRHSLCSIARGNQLSRSTLQQWVAFYKDHGVMGLQLSGRKKYDGAFKINAIQIFKREQLSLSDTCVLLKIPATSMLLNWIKKYEYEGVEAFLKKSDRTHKRLIMQDDAPKKPAKPKTKEQELGDENKFLRAENAYLKKLYALIQKEEAEKRKKQ
jgi:transposase